MYIIIRNLEEEYIALNRLQLNNYKWSNGYLPKDVIKENNRAIRKPPYYIHAYVDENKITYGDIEDLFGHGRLDQVLSEGFCSPIDIDRKLQPKENKEVYGNAKHPKQDLIDRLNKVIDLLDISGKNTKLQAKIELEKIINELGEEENE